LKSGVHATIAGVLIGLLVSTRAPAASGRHVFTHGRWTRKRP
jgi:Na+/H+ antiporter NhaA